MRTDTCLTQQDMQKLKSSSPSSDGRHVCSLILANSDTGRVFTIKVPARVPDDAQRLAHFHGCCL